MKPTPCLEEWFRQAFMQLCSCRNSCHGALVKTVHLVAVFLGCVAVWKWHLTAYMHRATVCSCIVQHLNAAQHF